MQKNIFDEKVYLEKRDDSALSMFRHDREAVLKLYSEESKLYNDIFKEYYKFINKLVNFMKSLNLSNSIEYSVALQLLIYNGYLSNEMKFNRKEPTNELMKDCGINIIMGEGCCRNFTDFHYDVMLRLNQYVRNFHCARPRLFQNIKTMRANHMLNLIEFDNALYGIDLSNSSRLFKFVDGYTLREISFNLGIKLRNKPYYELIYTNKTVDDILESIKQFEIDSKKQHISPLEYYDDMFPQIVDKLRKQKQNIIDFYDETKILKENICEGMSKKLTNNKTILK